LSLPPISSNDDVPTPSPSTIVILLHVFP
jgi:hypothetical protein